MPTSTDISLPLLPGQAYHIYNRGNEKRPIFFQEDNFSYFLKRYQDYIKGYMGTYAYCLIDNHLHISASVKSGEKIIAVARSDKEIKLDTHFVRRYVMPYLKSIDVEAQLADLTDLRAVDLTDLRAVDLTELRAVKDLTDLQDLLNLLPPLQLTTLTSDYETHPEQLTDLPFTTQLCSYIVSQRMRRFLLSYAKSVNVQQERTGSLFQKPFRRKWITTRDDLKSIITYIHHNVIHHGYDVSFERYPWSSYREYISDKKDSILWNDALSIFGSKTEFVQYSTEYQDRKIEEMEFK